MEAMASASEREGASSAAGVPPAIASDREGSAWARTVNSASRSVVVVKMYVRQALEGGPQAYVSEGTGFVVDSELGIVLTNR